MRKIFTYMISAGAAVVMLASCSLELEPTSAIVFKEGARIIATPQDLQAFESGIIADYRAVHGGMYNIIEDVMTDQFNASADFGNNYGGVHRTDDSFGSSDDYVDSYWGNHYAVIKDYNVLIDALYEEQNIPEGYAAYCRMVQGEAYFCRAEAYLNLVRHFGKDYDPADTQSLGVPLVLHYDLYALPARNTVHEVYAQIKADLDSAAVMLATEPGEVGAMYPTIDAVNALYARYYLDVEDYENAIKAADAVIGTNKYALAKDSKEMDAEYKDDAGSEAIMQMYGSKSELPNSTSVYTSMFSSQENGVCSRALFLPTKKLVDAYGAGDLRKAAWFSTTDFYTEVNGSYYRGNFATFVKFIGNSALYSGEVPNGCHMTKPYKISEMYLIKAEAQAQLGNVPGARATLGIIQTARGAAKTGGSLEDVQLEWFRETPGEGFRLSCLKRWHVGFEAREGQAGALNVHALMTGTYYTERAMAADDYHFVWPVPAGEIRLNPNLEQNDNYGIQ